MQKLINRIRAAGLANSKWDGNYVEFIKPGPLETILLTITLKGDSVAVERLYHHDCHCERFNLSGPKRQSAVYQTYQVKKWKSEKSLF